MKNIIYTLFALLCLVLDGCSQENSLTIPSYEGVVVNSLTNQPFAGITVSVTNGSNVKLSTTTNDNGEFEFSLNIEGLSGDYYIQIGNNDTENKQIAITGVGKIENNLGIIEIEPDTRPTCKIVKVELNNGIITLTGEIESSGYSGITGVGFYLSKQYNVSNESIAIKATLADKEFSVTYEENKLDIATEYYFIPYAINGSGEGLGTAYKFVTDGYLPIVNWQSYPSTPIYVSSATSVVMYAEIQNNGGSEIVERGFCWDTSGQPNIDSNKKYLTGTSNYYNIEITNLAPSTTYYARPYVKNKRGGLGYGTIMSFETVTGLPEVKSEKISATPDKIDMWGRVSKDNGLVINRCGFCYSTNPSPTINDNVIEYSSPQLGSFSVTATDVLDGTQYFARAFAENESGIAYGEILSITTPVFIKIKVTDSQGLGIPGATINIGNSTFTCDNSGVKELQAEPGIYQCTASATGYKTSPIQSINITRNNKLFDIELQTEPEYVELSSYGIAVQTKDIGWGDYDSIVLMCESSTVGGYTDWRLPTKEELMILYTNRDFIGNFSNKSDRRSYWSIDTDNGWPYYINFYDGSIHTSHTSNTMSGRCVRTLTK